MPTTRPGDVRGPGGGHPRGVAASAWVAAAAPGCRPALSSSVVIVDYRPRARPRGDPDDRWTAAAAGRRRQDPRGGADPQGGCPAVGGLVAFRGPGRPPIRP